MFQSDQLALAYDDVLITPAYSEILPHETDLRSYFSKNIKLNIPIASSAMDTVTESQTAIVMAQEGGIGVIHKNMDSKSQAKEVKKVKNFEAGIIMKPITVSEDMGLDQVFSLIDKFGFSGFPVVNKESLLIGILTNRDIRFESDMTKKVKDIMTPICNLVSAKQGISIEEAKKIMAKSKVEKLPLVDADGVLCGLITTKDIVKSKVFPLANKDELGRLRVAAAIGVGDKEFERAQVLIDAKVDALVVDTAHGHSKGVIEMIKRVKSLDAQVDVIAGNVATSKACQDLIDAGADGVKVGIGPGSICTTRVVAGIGVPQLQALMDCKEICEKKKIPFIADGGIKFSGDIVKALAVGASTVMIGSLFAGTDEAPGQRVLYQGRSFKTYRGMGSLGSMILGSKDRYGQASVEQTNKLVPEGIEGQVPYRGPLSENIYQLLGGIRSGMGYTGSCDLKQLTLRAKFVRITGAGLKESHPHDVKIIKEAPNYRS